MEPSWRWVARGLTLKLVGLLVGLLAFPLALIAVVLWDEIEDIVPNLTSSHLLAAIVGLLGFGILLDWVGRCFCLTAPSSVQGRPMMVTSVALQFLALTFATTGVLANVVPLPADVTVWSVFLAAVVLSGACQFAAACCFSSFLQSLARHVDRPDIEGLAGKVVGLLTALFPSILSLAVLAAIVIVVSIALGFCGFFVFMGGAIVWIPVAAVVAVVALVMYAFYGIVLLQLRSAIVNRLDSEQAFREME